MGRPEDTIDTLVFFEGKPQALAVYEVLRDRICREMEDVQIRVQKTQISFYDRCLFACASLPKRKREDHLVVTFGLWYPAESPRIAAKVEPYPGRWTHHVAVRDMAEVDETLMEWIRQAHSFAASKR